jgi:PKD repeat protein
VRRFALLFATIFVVACSPVGPDSHDRPGPSDAPRLASVSPGVTEIRVEAGARLEFHVEATSPRAKPLTITFLVDGDPRAVAPTFAFQTPTAGTYRISAIVSDGELETAHEWMVTVEPRPNVAPGAVLSVEPGGGEAPLRARIRVEGDDSDGHVIRYRLELLGPATPLIIEREAPIDTLVILGAGSWQATAVVEDDRGATAVASRAIDVSPPNLPPVPRLQVDPATGTAPLDVLLDAGGSDPDGEIESYRLEVDGELDIESSSPIRRSIRFERAGSFWVRIAVTDDDGAEARDSLAVHVSERNPEPPLPPPPPANAAPTVGLVVSPVEGEAPLEVEAQATAGDADGTVTVISIDFDGDGQPDSTAAGSSLLADHRFENAGTYTIRASAVDDDGAVATATRTVTVRPPANLLPTGSLSLSVTSGDAPLEVRASAEGTDPDGRIVKWEIEANEGDGFLELDGSRAATLVYAFDEAAYRPRLRLTDDDGATIVVVGPAVLVYRPIAGADASVRGNPRFDATAIAPAVWSDGVDRWRFTVTVRDAQGEPLGDVQLRVIPTRSPLAAPDGTSLGPGASPGAGDLRTGADGSAVGTLTTTLSTRIERAPTIDFQPFALRVEADAGHGQWREVARIEGLNANTTVSATASRLLIHPANAAVCPGTPIEFEVQARSRPDAPTPGAPAGGRYAELRYTDGSILQAAPRPGYGAWRTDGAGVIRFAYTPTRADQSKLVEAWVDGQPIGELAIIALKPSSQCSS